MNEPAIDLGIIMALGFQLQNRAIDEKMIVFGEVGLSGEVRAVSMPEQRVQRLKNWDLRSVSFPKYVWIW